MDNFYIDIAAELSNLDAALGIALSQNAPGGKVSHYAVLNCVRFSDDNGEFLSTKIDDENGVPTLILYWSDCKYASKLPFSISKKNITSFVEEWLEQNEEHMKKLDDYDVSEYLGFRLFTDYWGHVLDSPYAVCAIQPYSVYCGK